MFGKKTVTTDGFKCEDVRGLREALSFIARTSSDSHAKGRALMALKNFAVAVGPYCTHTERSTNSQCLWCGQPEGAKH